MKKLVVLAVLTFALGSAHHALACDFGAHAANATPIVVATTEAPSTDAAKPETAAPKVTSTDPLAPPATVACSNDNC